MHPLTSQGVQLALASLGSSTSECHQIVSALLSGALETTAVEIESVLLQLRKQGLEADAEMSSGYPVINVTLEAKAEIEIVQAALTDAGWQPMRENPYNNSLYSAKHARRDEKVVVCIKTARVTPIRKTA